MNLIIKQIIVMVITFFIILWFQNREDSKNNKDRDSYYEKYKLPLLVSAIIGLILNIPSLFKQSECINENITEINIITPVNDIKNCDSHPYNDIKKIIDNLEITTGLPDF